MVADTIPIRPGDTRDRALAALYGLAVGDALGMPTQMMSPEAVVARFGTLHGFQAADVSHPLASGMPAGSVTDDTEQAILLAEALVDGGGHIDAADFARRLIEWEDTMRAKGSLDLLGPSTKAAVAAIVAGGLPSEAGRAGTTNGAAMRVTPIGLAVTSSNLTALVDRVVEASFVTHNTGVAIAGAAAIAAAVSAGIEGATTAQATTVAIEIAGLGASRGNWVAAASVARRIEWAVSLADPAASGESLRRIRELIGTSLATQESVPAAFGILATFPDDPWRACLAAAAQGGDSDTVAAMAGAVAGACHGMDGFPEDAVTVIRTVNRLAPRYGGLEGLAERLLALRP